MPAKANHSPKAAAVQVPSLVGDEWEQTVVPRLPAGLAAQARALGAFQRVRGVDSPSDLLRALLAFALCAPSGRQLGAWALLVGLADISEAAWRKRLGKSRRWLGWLLGELLAVPPASANLVPPEIRRILVVDGTTLAQHGAADDEWRLHASYDLLAGRWVQVAVTDHHSGEHLGHHAIQAGDLVVADRNYCSLANLARARRADAHLLVRYKLGACPPKTDQHQGLDVVAWLRAAGEGIQEMLAWCWCEGVGYPVRLVACALPQEQADIAKRKLRTLGKAKGYTPSAEALFLAGWVVLLTSMITPAITAAELLRLYRARWQIEVVFKRFKQCLAGHQIRARTEAAAQATIYAILVAWAFQEDEAAHAQACLLTLLAPTPALPIGATGTLSTWTLTALCLETLRGVVRGAWSLARWQACLPRLARFLVTSPRRRRHQASDLRAWLPDLLDRLAAAPRPTAA